MCEWKEVGSLEEIPQQGARIVKQAGQVDIALFRTVNNEVFALRDQCPHKKGPLSQGVVHGKSVTCPLHSWVIDLETGEAKAPDEGCAGHIPCQVVEGKVLLKL